MKTNKVPFDIYIPATEHRAAVKVDTITIETYTGPYGDEMVTAESTLLIEKTQARYMGLLAGQDIVALRLKLGLSQEQLSEKLGCGKKSLSRWENGREYPSQLVNTLLRLLEEERVNLEDLAAVRQPRVDPCEKIVHFIHSRRNAPHTYDLHAAWRKTDLGSPLVKPIAM